MSSQRPETQPAAPVIPSDLTTEGREVWSRMVSGQPYWDMHPELERKRMEARRLFETYNRTDFEDTERRRALLERLLGSVGENVVVEPNFRCDLGCNIHLGEGSFVNYDCVMFDAAPITIGKSVWIAPMVGLFTTNHALDYDERAAGGVVSRPITIGDGAWLGAHVVVLDGVTIGRGAVIGAGSVVTRDVPGNVVAAGNPARVLRPITDADRMGFTK
ncbi:acetyltransferase [Bifidobacterium goeldii]|uniref:Acetyltransferase n=2 Tax=Bifidobacterium goeldii TaxID=2306975 RepID=A0A430FMB3_9BIFI|nr:acetyltransferase [Bifidobacterium goeldii]